MSISLMSIVWKTELGGGVLKAVAMKLADCASDNGENVYPSIRTVARATEASERSVQYAIKTLVKRQILLPVKTGGKGPGSTNRYRFNMPLVMQLHTQTMEKWAAEDEQDKGAKSAPLKGARKGANGAAKGAKCVEKGAAVAPDPSVQPSITKTPSTPSDLFLPGAGERLIPFSGTDVASIVAAEMKQPVAERRGVQSPEKLPFSPAVLRQVAMLGVQTGPLVDRYAEKTKGKRIKDPSAYLLEMARDQAAKTLGVTPEVLKEIASTDTQESVAAMAAAVGVVREVPEWMARAPTNRDRSALTRTTFMRKAG